MVCIAGKHIPGTTKFLSYIFDIDVVNGTVKFFNAFKIKKNRY